MIVDVGDLVLVASVPLPVAIGLLSVFGFTTAAVVLSVVGFVGVVPLHVQFGPRLLADGAAADGKAAGDPVASLRERYVACELSEAEFEREVERLLEAGAVEGTFSDASAEVTLTEGSVEEEERPREADLEP